jgi:hypothetical protein
MALSAVRCTARGRGGDIKALRSEVILRSVQRSNDALDRSSLVLLPEWLYDGGFSKLRGAVSRRSVP